MIVRLRSHGLLDRWLEAQVTVDRIYDLGNSRALGSAISIVPLARTRNALLVAFHQYQWLVYRAIAMLFRVCSPTYV